MIQTLGHCPHEEDLDAVSGSGDNLAQPASAIQKVNQWQSSLSPKTFSLSLFLSRCLSVSTFMSHFPLFYGALLK